MYDQDHQLEILGQEDQDMALEPLLKLVEAKEIGCKTHVSILGEMGGTGNSSYKTLKNLGKQPNKSVKCRFCSKMRNASNIYFCGQSTADNWKANWNSK
jgi:hypothetical protein